MEIARRAEITKLLVNREIFEPIEIVSAGILLPVASFLGTQASGGVNIAEIAERTGMGIIVMQVIKDLQFCYEKWELEKMSDAQINELAQQSAYEKIGTIAHLDPMKTGKRKTGVAALNSA